MINVSEEPALSLFTVEGHFEDNTVKSDHCGSLKLTEYFNDSTVLLRGIDPLPLFSYMNDGPILHTGLSLSASLLSAEPQTKTTDSDTKGHKSI
jgi:hypothetical protein